jgi:DNA repair exonuclease SbcCD ATPase subunit
MTRYFIRALAVEGFRGINNAGDPLRLRFKPGAVNSVFAPNAQGKSSMFEALCYAIKGVVPKLEEMPASDRPSEYYANRFHQGSPAIISLTLEPDDGSPQVEISVERLVDGTRRVVSPSGYPDPDGLLKSLDTEMCLVDNRAFLRFVEDTPLERGRSFSSLLGIGELSEFRQALETLAHGRTVASDFEIKSLETSVEGQSRELQRKEVEIRDELRSLADVALPEPLNLADVNKAAIASLKQIKVLRDHVDGQTLEGIDWSQVKEAIKTAEQSEKQTELAGVEQSLAVLRGLDASEDEAGAIDEVVSAAEALDDLVSQTKGSKFQDLYSRALAVVTSDEWDDEAKCPVCDSRLGFPLTDHLESCLAGFAAAQKSAEALREKWQRASWVDRLGRLAASTDLAVDKKEARQIADIGLQVERLEASTKEVGEVLAVLKKLDDTLLNERQVLEGKREDLRAVLPPSLVAVTEQVGHAERLSSALETYGELTASLDADEAKLGRRKAWVGFIKTAATAFQDAEVSLSTAKTQALESAYKSFYSEITRNPEIVPALRKASGSEGLHLVLERFFGLEDLSAPSLLPESYRNALAISIFLSAALESTAPARFIVMDDVTSSFDAGHQFQLMELIRTRIARPGNPAGPQVIMLSHDGLLEKYFDRLSADAVWHHQKIQGLPPRGAVFTHTQQADRHRAKAEQFLRAGQVDQGEPLVRQYLEFRLQQIIRKVGVPVPFDFAMRDDRKLVQGCLDAISEGVSLHKAAGDLILTRGQLARLETQHLPAIVGNWVSHYATGVVSSFDPHALLGVLDSVDELAGCFMYDCSCSGSTRRRFYKSLSAKHCSC